MLLVGLAAPALLPLARAADGWAAWREAGRLAELAATTLTLAGLAAVVAVPAGAVAGVLVERLPLPGRRLLKGLVVVGLVVPLPVYAAGWQAVFGSWLPAGGPPGTVSWRPWTTGLLPAAWAHGMAGLPWAAFLVGTAVRTADPGLEEAALLDGGLAAVARRVWLPRAVPAAALAAGWVLVQASTEVVVTDAMMVRTFAEEVYTRFVGGNDGLAPAVAITVPGWLLTAAAVGVLLRWGGRFTLPPADAGPAPPLWPPPWLIWAGGIGIWLGAAVVAGVPLVALVLRCRPPAKVLDVLASDGATLLVSLAAAGGSGLLAAGLAWPACHLARGSRWFGGLLAAVCVLLAVAPGPVVGFGLKELILHLLDAEAAVLELVGWRPDFPPLASLLYDQPSPLPGMWAAAVRLFPLAVAILWPAVRAVPQGLLDAAAVDGVSCWKWVVGPLTGPAFVRAGVAVAALALGEVSATKLVQPPAAPSFVLRLFDQMHYGTDPTVAALCLVQVAAAAGLAITLSAGPSGRRSPAPGP
jgi:ABC-type Fe3+ transport system permease subunit